MLALLRVWRVASNSNSSGEQQFLFVLCSQLLAEP